MSGQVTSVAKQVFRRALLEVGPRLVEAMFLCEISTTSEALSGPLFTSPPSGTKGLSFVFQPARLGLVQYRLALLSFSSFSEMT